MKAKILGNLAQDPIVKLRDDGSRVVWLNVIEDVVNPATGDKVDIDVWSVKVYDRDALNPGTNGQFAAALKKGAWVSIEGRYHRRPKKDAAGKFTGYYEYLSPTSLSTFVTTKQSEVKAG